MEQPVMSYQPRPQSPVRAGLSVAQPRAHEIGMSKPTILLVEDNPIAAQAEAWLLESLGYDVILAPDGHRALAQCHDQLHAVIVDIDLPDISGLTVAHQLRAQYPQLPLIACTGTDRCSALQYTQAGFDHVLVKPMRLSDIASPLILGRHTVH